MVGLDEWAKRKGRTHATVVVDQERHQIVDVLPDDQPETVTAWLQAHPTIRVVTRDRDEAFAKAIAARAPDATQVADRFYLLLNLGDLLERPWARLRPTVPVSDLPAPAAEMPAADPAHPVPSQPARWETIQHLATTGWSVSAIARHLHLTRKTVRTYQQAPTGPVRAIPPPRRRPVLDALTARLEGLWQAGDHHASTLYRTIQVEGDGGGLATVTHRVQQRRGPALPPERPVTARAFATWCLLPWDKLSRRAGRRLTPYFTVPELRQAYRLAHLFRTLLRARRPLALTAWLRVAGQSGIPEFGRFVAHLHRDLAAVQAATTEPWSPG
ncbi:MAG: transposase [Clostridia bacterium]